MSEPTPFPRVAPKRAGWRRALIAAAVGIALAFALGEAAVRFLLFHPSDLALRLGKDLRRIESFGDPQSDEDVWRLQWSFSDRGGGQPNPTADPVVGWRGPILPGYLHPQGSDLERTLRGRRLVLLFGDSYAQCNTPSNQCFQRLLQESDLGSQYFMLNCGVGGYGLDQIHLLIRQVAPNYAEYSPLVVVSVFADDDLDRTVLGFRCWPKPRLALRDGALDSGGPVETDLDAYLARHPLPATSYFHRLLAWRKGILPLDVQRAIRVDEPRIEEKRALSRALLDATAADLRALGLDFFLVSFQGEKLLQLAGPQWQEELLAEFARDEGVGLVPTEPFLLAASGGNVELALQLFGGTAQLAGHYNPEGNRVAFEAIRQGLLGRFDPLDTSAVARTEAEARAVDVHTFTRPARLLGRRCAVTWRGPDECLVLGLPGAPSHEDQGTFSVRAGERGGTSVAWDLEPRKLQAAALPASSPSARRWKARARVDAGGSARVLVSVDGGPPAEHVLEPRRPSGNLEIGIDGARRLELRVEPIGRERSWVVFEDASFE